MIIVDTREQKPIWEEKEGVKFQKLDEGDYTTAALLNVAHIERKSGIDLYGSLIQGHKRFAAELQRAIEKDLTFAVFVECSFEDFVRKKFKGGYRLKVSTKILRKIIATFMKNHPVEFVWCDGREDLKEKAEKWFLHELKKIVKPNAGFHDHNVPSRAVSEEKIKKVTWG